MGNTAPTPGKESENVPASNQESEPQNQRFPICHPSNRMACCYAATRIIYVVLCVVTMLQSIAMIAATVVTAIATNLFSNHHSGRLGAMIVLTITSAIALSVTIYAMVAILRKQQKPVRAAASVLIILAIIQAIVIGVSVQFTVDEEVQVTTALSESFTLARANNQRQVKVWDAVQHDLKCCGMNNAEDYRLSRLPPYFAPDIPISCCPVYESGRSQLLQEREREACKAKRDYYKVGCNGSVIEVYRSTAHMVISFTIALIILMIILSVIGAFLTAREYGNTKSDAENVKEDVAQVVINQKTKT